MNRGWVRLHRKTIDSRVFKNEGLLKVWIWCLCRANYEKCWISVSVGRNEMEVELQRGQFIFGRKSAADDLNMNESTVWKRMNKLKNMKNLTIESNTNYSIVSIMNYDSYQGNENKSNSDSNSRVTAGEQLGNTGKNYNNPNNPKKELYVETSDEVRLSNLLLSKILENQPTHKFSKKPPDIQKWAKDIDLTVRIDGRSFQNLELTINWLFGPNLTNNTSFVVQSPFSLREKFDRIWGQMQKNVYLPSSPAPSKNYKASDIPVNLDMAAGLKKLRESITGKEME